MISRSVPTYEQNPTARGSLRSRCLLSFATLCVVICVGSGCDRNEPQNSHPDSKPINGSETSWDLPAPLSEIDSRAEQPIDSLKFVERQHTFDTQHVFNTGGEGNFLAVETLGGGCGWIDYDSDGFWDFVCNQGDRPDLKDRHQTATDALFRNTNNHFVKVDQNANFADSHFSQSVAVGDFDDDGFQDIYISNVFENTFWRNNGDGTFIESAKSCGIDDPRWSSTAAWADLNHDGLLDLYVCNYLKYDPTNPVDCYDGEGQKMLCNPASIDPWPNACYINLGDGTFREESEKRGFNQYTGRSLSVAVADFTGDRLVDIYVANDTDDNFLFVNQGQGVFKEEAVLRGCATNHLGIREAGMGIAVNDFDKNGLQDIYVTHYSEESNTLYKNLGNNGFQDITNLAGLHQSTLPFLGFGTTMQDFDQNGQMDLFIANGHVVTAAHNPRQQMPAQLFSFDGHNQWREISELAGQYFEKNWLGRGVATADFDDDGDLDLLILNLDQPACLLRNDSERGNWINVSFRGRTSNRFGVGVNVEMTTQTGAREINQSQQLCGGTSFASTHQPILSFGLGPSSDPVDLHIIWPSGLKETLTAVQPNQHIIVDEKNAVTR